ncbi:MAG: methylated-DNA--[protein]-cysteine S-methyltransferase [Rikenellaceae bacterium]|nr:methylated-DNA--[protein]-cysteine S-methyltransferase [Rikenellaceae bacterium]
MKNCYFYDTSLGRIGIAEKEGFITDMRFGGRLEPFGHARIRPTPLIEEAIGQLRHYLTGERLDFDLPLQPEGTDFQQKVWKALCGIPYGETRSYGQIARRVGNPKASRAVGLANNRNPISIFIPCHRVIGADGKLVGYGGGIPIKKRLLELERSACRKTLFSGNAVAGALY